MIGKQIGHYRIDKELGEGGMSHVYIGRTTEATPLLPDDFVVVLKIMSDELATEVTARKRFIKEAQILSRLRHRNITRFYEFIPRETGSVLIMEYVEGEPVDRMISRIGALEINDAVHITQCLLEALVYAHAKGIVHRDIKPANLIRQPDGDVKVTDFGIAKIKESAGGGGGTVLTRSGLLLGTPHYMSPEQIREPQDAGAKSDLYSTGVLLYEMLTGVLPFQGNSLRKLIDAIYKGEKKPPSAVQRGIDTDLDAIVLKAMHPEMDKRYDSALDFLEALANYDSTPRKGMAAGQDSEDEEITVKRSTEVWWELISTRSEGSEKHEVRGASDFTVGRDKTCSIVISHPAVSRKHAKLFLAGPLLHVEDLKSANGTFVNNSRVAKAELKPGDVVRFGADPNCSFVVKERA
jgi:serine/threonine-protein kinase